MNQTVTLPAEQWQLLLNQLGRGRFNRVAAVYLTIQQQLREPRDGTYTYGEASAGARGNGAAARDDVRVDG